MRHPLHGLVLANQVNLRHVLTPRWPIPQALCLHQFEGRHRPIHWQRPRGCLSAIRASLQLQKCDWTTHGCWINFGFRRRERWRTPHRTSYGRCLWIHHHNLLVQWHLRRRQQPKAGMDRFGAVYPEVGAIDANRTQSLLRGPRFWNK